MEKEPEASSLVNWPRNAALGARCSQGSLAVQELPEAVEMLSWESCGGTALAGSGEHPAVGQAHLPSFPALSFQAVQCSGWDGGWSITLCLWILAHIFPPVLPWGPSHRIKSFRSFSSVDPPWATAPERAPAGSSFFWSISPCSRGALQGLPGVSTPSASPGAEGPSCSMESWRKLLPCPYHCWAGSHPCPSLLSPTAAALRFLPFLGGGSSSSAGLGPGMAAVEPAGPQSHTGTPQGGGTGQHSSGWGGREGWITVGRGDHYGMRDHYGMGEIIMG